MSYCSDKNRTSTTALPSTSQANNKTSTKRKGMKRKLINGTFIHGSNEDVGNKYTDYDSYKYSIV